MVIVLYDPKTKYAGMAHAMLPAAKGSEIQRKQFPERYVEIAIDILIVKLEKKGVPQSALTAYIAGGAQMFSAYQDKEHSIGNQNIESVQVKLTELSIPVIEQELGGSKGRNVSFDTSSGEFSAKSKM